jgi:type I restriction enzyme S subunit
VTKAGRNRWPRVPIKEAYLGLYDGPHATPRPADDGPVFLGIGNITEDGHLDLRDIRHIAEEDYPHWTRRVTPRPEDIVFTYEATLNRYAIIPPSFRGCLGRRLALIRPNPERVDARFLYYQFFGEDWRRTVSENTILGATVDRIPLVRFPGFPVVLPPLPVQKRIAATLSAYDDLIDSNTRRIKILEEMARAIYREWFVHFRFPGHKKVRLVHSPLGPIPEGWNVARLSDLVDTQYGYTESATTNRIGPKFVRGMDINKNSFIDWSSVPYCKISEEDRPKYRLEQGDVLVIRMADPGKAGIVEKAVDAVFASYLIRVKTKSRLLTPYFLFHFLLSERYQGYITGASTGTTRKSASAGVIIGIDLVLPPVRLLEQFEERVVLVRSMLNNLLDRNTVLRRTRDYLLPKLISGELDVSEVEVAGE